MRTTDRPQQLTYRDAQIALALVDSWGEGRIRFAKGDFSVDAVIDGESRPPLPASSRFIVRAPAVGIFEPAPSALGGTTLVAADTIGAIVAPGRTTPIPTGATGVLTEVLVAPGTFVEYGQALAAVSIAPE